jgi:hypothetical protein
MKRKSSAKSTTRKKKLYRSVEKWNTRYGVSKRAVTRDANGRFVDNVSLSSL